jgi:nucleotidyltransferase/DNA polymerase involved in DNA repair
MTPKALLAKADSEQGRKELIRELKVPENEFVKLIRAAELAELKGMGTLNANLLNKAGIDHISDLAMLDPSVLYKKLLALNRQRENISLPREAIIRVWVREAQRRIND